MIAKRLLAGLAAAGMIVGALLVRDRVVDDGGKVEAEPPPRVVNTLVCVTELRDVCRAAVETLAGAPELLIADAATTHAELAALTDGRQAPMWLTFEPYAEMVGVERTIAGLPLLATTATELARSRIALVAPNERSQTIVDTCGEPFPLDCLDELIRMRPTFAPPASAIGTLTIAAAAAAEGGGVVDRDDPAFTVWARNMAQAGNTSLGQQTAVQTVQTRRTFVAVGVDAELAAAQREQFTAFVAEPPVWLDVTLLQPASSEVPQELVLALTGELLNRGWELADANAADGLPDAGVILGVAQFWEDVQ